MIPRHSRARPRCVLCMDSTPRACCQPKAGAYSRDNAGASPSPEELHCAANETVQRRIRMSATLNHLIAAHGYWVVAAIVGLESMGIPAPGETVLVAAGIYAGTTHGLHIGLVVAAAAAARLSATTAGISWAAGLGTVAILRYGYLVRLNSRRHKARPLPVRSTWREGRVLRPVRRRCCARSRRRSPGSPAWAGSGFSFSMRSEGRVVSGVRLRRLRTGGACPPPDSSGRRRDPGARGRDDRGGPLVRPRHETELSDRAERAFPDER